jgi:Txe/YoeB family toxin of Txe-Axe toxin-antitoxin module
MYNYFETKIAIKDRKLISKSYPKSTRDKLEYLVNEILETPDKGLGKPEPYLDK